MNESNDAVMRHLNAHYRPDVAADLLAAAQRHMAIAWDEGFSMGWGAARGESEEPNPYRKEPEE